MDKFKGRTGRIILASVIGAALGYAYYYFIGCNSGTCPITSNPYISTVYGGVAGIIIAFSNKKDDNSKK